jgi:4-amino-4-deoxy-L-arabinose transferase-like glycosyltransferase
MVAPGTQELIHSLEVGRGTRTIKLIVFGLAVVLFALWYNLNEFRSYSTKEAMEVGQLARNLSEGRGFTTHFIRPLTLQLVNDQQGVEARLSRRPHPDLANPPLYPVLLAGLMKVLPFKWDAPRSFWIYSPEMWIAIFNQVLFLVTLFLTFRLGAKLFDEAVGAIAAIVLAGSEVLWRFSVSGLSTMLALLIFVCLLWCLVKLEAGTRSEQSKGWGYFLKWGLATGMCAGLGALTRYSFVWLVIPVLAFSILFIRPRGWLVAGAIVAVFLLLLTPWLARNYQASGTLFGIPGFAASQDTLPFPGHRLERSFEPNLDRLEGRDYARKLFANSAEMMQDDLPRLGGSWVTAFFLPALFLPYRNRTLSRMRWFLLMTMLVFIPVQALGRTHLTTDSPVINTENLLVILTPGVFIFGVGLYFVLVEHVQLPIQELKHLMTGAFAFVACLPLAFTLLPPRTFPIAYPPYYPPWVQETSRFLKTDELMMSDMPWAVAWYGDRDCVWTPLYVGNPNSTPPDTRESFYTVYDEHKKVSGLYLTPITTNARFVKEMLQGRDHAWSRFALGVLVYTNLPPKFPLRDARLKYVPDQLFLSDRPRWQAMPAAEELPPRPQTEQEQAILAPLPGGTNIAPAIGGPKP